MVYIRELITQYLSLDLDIKADIDNAIKYCVKQGLFDDNDLLALRCLMSGIEYNRVKEIYSRIDYILGQLAYFAGKGYSDADFINSQQLPDYKAVKLLKKYTEGELD